MSNDALVFDRSALIAKHARYLKGVTQPWARASAATLIENTDRLISMDTEINLVDTRRLIADVGEGWLDLVKLGIAAAVAKSGTLTLFSWQPLIAPVSMVHFMGRDQTPVEALARLNDPPKRLSAEVTVPEITFSTLGLELDASSTPSAGVNTEEIIADGISSERSSITTGVRAFFPVKPSESPLATAWKQNPVALPGESSATQSRRASSWIARLG